MIRKGSWSWDEQAVADYRTLSQFLGLECHAYALVFPRTIRSETSPEIKSSSEGPPCSVWLKSFFEDGVAKQRIFDGARHRRFERRKALIANELRDIQVHKIRERTWSTLVTTSKFQIDRWIPCLGEASGRLWSDVRVFNFESCTYHNLPFYPLFRQAQYRCLKILWWLT